MPWLSFERFIVRSRVAASMEHFIEELTGVIANDGNKLWESADDRKIDG